MPDPVVHDDSVRVFTKAAIIEFLAVNASLTQLCCKSLSGVGVLLRHSDFSDRGAGGKVWSRRDDGVCLTTVTGPLGP